MGDLGQSAGGDQPGRTSPDSYAKTTSCARSRAFSFTIERDTWVRARRRQILHALGELNLAPKHSRAVYLCDPETPVKRNVYMEVPQRLMAEQGGPPLLILGDCGVVECGKLAPLLQNLRGRYNG